MSFAQKSPVNECGENEIKDLYGIEVIFLFFDS